MGVPPKAMRRLDRLRDILSVTSGVGKTSPHSSDAFMSYDFGYDCTSNVLWIEMIIWFDDYSIGVLGYVLQSC